MCPVNNDYIDTVPMLSPATLTSCWHCILIYCVLCSVYIHAVWCLAAKYRMTTPILFVTKFEHKNVQLVFTKTGIRYIGTVYQETRQTSTLTVTVNKIAITFSLQKCLKMVLLKPSDVDPDPIWIRIHFSATQWIRIRIQNTDPEPDPRN